jgi:hypothetical protein
VFSDEAAILVGEHRGMQRVLQTPEERFYPDVIEVQYNNYSEAMFWGCFLYDQKGPCHIYIEETAEQKAEYVQMIEEKNIELEPQLCKEFAKQEAKKAAK